MRSRLIISTITIIILALTWLIFLRDYSDRITQNEESSLFTTKIEEINEVDCEGIDELVQDAFCSEVVFRDPTDDKEAVAQVNGIATYNNFASNLEVGDLVRVSKTEVEAFPLPELENFGENVEMEELDFDLEERNTEGETEIVYIITGFDRINAYFLMVSVFILAVILVTGMRGVKSLISLALSLMIIVYIIVPLTIEGYNPILIASIIGFIMFSLLVTITNGLNKLSLYSIGGAGVGILATIIFTYLFTSITNLSGLGEEETGVLASVLEIDIDVLGIIMASFILGVLGVVDDASVSQVHTVAELIRSDPKKKRSEIFTSAMRVGSSHIGSLINTLLLAYVASSFALFILLSLREQSIIDLLSTELIAEEIVRTLVGSLGLVLSIPAATYLASMFLKPKDIKGEHTGHVH